MYRINTKTLRIAYTGLLFALAAVMSLIEGMIPAPLPVPGIKLGLSNVVTLYCLFSLSKTDAFMLAALKSLFVLFVRGASASAISFCGGMLSVTAMIAAMHISCHAGISVVSVVGAVFHNIGQLVAASAMLGLWAVFWHYMPVLIGFGIVMGIVTAILFKSLRPYLKSLNRK